VLCYIFRPSLKQLNSKNKQIKTAQLLYSQPSINYTCFEVHEKVEYAFITSITNAKSFRIVKIEGNICSRKCFCVKVYSLLAMRCEILHRGVWHCVSAKRISLVCSYITTIAVLVDSRFSTEHALLIMRAWEISFCLTSETRLEL